MAEPRVVTLTTDFGLRDPFVGTMHGVVLNIEHDIQVVDICHEIASYDVLEGALAIAQAYRFFPPRTVHVVVVDPGVGGARRPILAETDEYVFVAPDNGVLTLVETREARFSVRHITAERFFLQPVSQTFHGRDIFSPVAAWLAKGVAPADFGPEITDQVRLAIPGVERQTDGSLRGAVLKVDKFGNLITNLSAAEFPHLGSIEDRGFRLTIGGQTVARVCPSYGEGQDGEIFAILGSSGFLEVAMRQDSAAQKLGVGVGAPLTVLGE
jgi:S-adenosylmethionine hydrolase